MEDLHSQVEVGAAGIRIVLLRCNARLDASIILFDERFLVIILAGIIVGKQANNYKDAPCRSMNSDLPRCYDGYCFTRIQKLTGVPAAGPSSPVTSFQLLLSGDHSSLLLFIPKWNEAVV